MKRLRDLLWNDSGTIQKMDILRDRMKHLAAREADVRTEIENAELQLGKRRREEVAHWLNNVKLKKGEVESIEKECQQQATSSSSQIFGHTERLTKDVQELIQLGGFLNGLVLDDQNSRAVPFPMAGFVGKMFHQYFETIMKWLEDGKAFIIGVHGMGGAGKTTLLKSLYNHVLHSCGIVERVRWVTVSQDCSSYKLQRKILRAVSGLKDFDEEDEAKRAQVLNNMLTKMGKTLLILDDVWDPYTLEEIGIPLRETGCKIILSSRGMENLKCLKKVNCWWNLDDNNYFNRMGEYRHFFELISYQFFLYRAPKAPTIYDPHIYDRDFEKEVIILGSDDEFGEAVSSSYLSTSKKS